MEQFRSGWKKSYYGKGDISVYRLRRQADPAALGAPVFGATVKILLYGEAFWPTYTEGDNTNLVATDSMKNFVQRETLNYTGDDLEAYCLFLGQKFLSKYPQTEGLQISATEIPYGAINESGLAFQPAGPDAAFATLELVQGGEPVISSGVKGYKMLRLRGSAFKGFIRDEYTTLPDLNDRPLHMWLDTEWIYSDAKAALSEGKVTAAVRKLVHDVFCKFKSGSIQEVIYKLGERILAEVPPINEIHLEANNRTWDTIVESPDLNGVYTDARPPYGCLGLRLKR
jgi:urate oxidase/2-oxo-4-hydroxy-4-carboxy-5-ureidoimidazoline decarboxylase